MRVKKHKQFRAYDMMMSIPCRICAYVSKTLHIQRMIADIEMILKQLCQQKGAEITKEIYVQTTFICLPLSFIFSRRF